MRNTLRFILLACTVGCSDPSASGHPDARAPDGATSDAATESDAGAAGGLGSVGGVQDLPSCPNGAPAGATCKRVRVSGCPGIETESIDATLAILAPQTAIRGTIVHLSGGGGEGFEGIGATNYRVAGFQQVFVAWGSDWEQTASSGIRVAGCRPSTLLKWIFDDIHGGSQDAAFCGQGKSGGSGQLGYALAHYGMGSYLDYVNELSGPPFARIDLGCDGDAPPTAQVCGATVTMQLPDKVGPWENIPPPLTCGSTNVPPDELARWRDDSIAYGGVYDYPQTRVEFFDCTNNSTAVTAMAKLYYDEIVQAEPDPARSAYHCYSQADGCQGEGLGTGENDAIQSMISGCTPRHQ